MQVSLQSQITPSNDSGAATPSSVPQNKEEAPKGLLYPIQIDTSQCDWDLFLVHVSIYDVEGKLFSCGLRKCVLLVEAF